MRKAILLFVLLTLFGIPYLLAQGGFRITGQILSAEDNLPVIGVSVVEWINETGSLYSNAGSIRIIWNFCISNRGSLKEMGVADTKAFSLNKKKSSNGRVISDL